MKIVIHRGTNQIGGCVTELRSGSSRIFIDFGTELPELDGTQKAETLAIPGLTEGAPDCKGVFFTHSHGDHIGNIGRILDGIPIYIGPGARAVSLVLNNHLQRAHTHKPEIISDKTAEIKALMNAVDMKAGKCIQVGDFCVTPLWVDHSAFDAYMLLIEAEGLRVLHTGDFRDHGFMSGKLIPALATYAGTVDWLITEGTMLSRPGEKVMTEKELQQRARAIMAENGNVFVLCSSTNIDRIRAFYQAKPYDRPAICDKYQKDILNTVEKYAPRWNHGYRFDYVIPDAEWNYKLHNWRDDKGFLIFVRDNGRFCKVMEPYRGNCKVIYSMWSGYLQKESTKAFLAGYDYEQLHTSGHADEKTLCEVCDTVRPRKGVIPIHTEAPERFCELFKGENVVLLNNGQELAL